MLKKNGKILKLSSDAEFGSTFSTTRNFFFVYLSAFKNLEERQEMSRKERFTVASA